jgi:hypothetical protein
MLTLNVKVSRELASIVKLQNKLEARVEKIRRLVNNGGRQEIVTRQIFQSPPANSPILKAKVETQEEALPVINQNNAPTLPKIPRTWGPGRKVPQSVRLEIASCLKKGMRGHQIKKHFNVSLPTVWKIKDELGMVKHRGVFMQ